MRWILAALVTLTTSSALAIERPCTDGKVWDQNLGACAEVKAAPKASPRENYNRALAILERSTGTRRAIPLLDRACRNKFGPACTQLGAIYKTGRHVKSNPNKSLEAYSKACNLSDSTGCLGAAEHHTKGLGGAQNFKKALTFYGSACKLGSGSGCYRSAEASLLGRGTKQDKASANRGFNQAARILERECRKDIGPSCYLLGLALQNGYGLSRSPMRAFAVLARGCEAGSGDACYQKAVAIRDGVGTRPNPTEAQRMFEDACKRYDSGNSCFAAGQLLAARGVDDDEKKTLEALGARACELDKKHCLLLSRLIDTELLGKPDPGRAFALAGSACEHGNGLACFDTGLKMLEGPERFRNVASGIKRLRRACGLAYALACEQLAIYHDSGEFVRESPTEATILRANACQLGYGPSCTEGGRAALEGRGGRAVDGKKALAFFVLGCQLRDGESCSLAASMHRKGEGGLPKKLEPALTYLRGACNYQFSTGCTELGQIYDRGLGVKRNRAVARQWYLRACDYGDQRPCQRAAELTPPGSELRDRVAQRIDKACDRMSPNEGVCMVMAAQLARGGNLFDLDERRAFRIAQPACEERNYHPACVFLADLYRNGIGTIRNRERSVRLLKDLCGQDVPRACTKLAHYYLREKSYRSALPLYRRACRDGDPGACNNYAYHHYIGQGAPWNVAIAIDYWTRACQKGSATGCANLADAYEFGVGVETDLERAVALYRQTCTPELTAGCSALGRLVLSGKLEGNSRLAIRNLQRSCTSSYLPDARACQLLVEHYRANPRGGPRPAELARWTQRAYDLADRNRSNPFSLYLLGTFHRDGFGAVRDLDQAGELFVAACTGYDPFGCMAAGDLYSARGERRDLQRAQIYYGRACAAEIAAGCERSERLRAGKLPLGPGKGANGCACRSAQPPGTAWFGLAAVVLMLACRRRRASLTR
ncbi:MAG: sel1 repeat family protein [Deltaproteobacteria bacterium]|nr:sel1 repeat family protein [Deltaproteobacteria bacterium]